MRSRTRRFVAALVVVASCQSLFTAPAAAQRGRAQRRQAATRAVGWEAVPAILARIRPPRFPARDFPVTDFGAREGSDSTDAIRKAIDACSRAGGGRVVIPAGTFTTGAVHLKSNVNLHVSRGATLRFSTDPRKYLPVVFTRYEGTEVMNYSPLIYAFEQQNIAVTGEGTLDGGASDDNWWKWARRGPGGSGTSPQAPDVRRLREMAASGVPVERRVFGEGYHLRPPFIQPYRSRNILIEGVTIINSPFWEIHPVLSQNVTVRRVNVRTHGPNNDGCDPESSRDVLIEDCVFDTGDDCIAIKSGRDDDGRRINVPSENIIIRNSTMKDGHGGVVIGSEISGGVRNVFVENCKMDSPNLDRALRFKSNARRGGVMENVFMRNVQIGRVAESVLTIDLVYFNEQGPYKPVVRNVQIENVTSANSPRVMWVVGFPGATVENVRFKDCEFRGLEAAEVVNHAGSISFENVRFEPARRGRSANSPQPPPTQ